MLTTRRQGNEANIRRLEGELSDQESRSGDLQSQIAARQRRLREIEQETKTQQALRGEQESKLAPDAAER